MRAFSIIRDALNGTIDERTAHNRLFELGYSVQVIGNTHYLLSHKNRVVGAVAIDLGSVVPANDIAEARAWHYNDSQMRSYKSC